MNRRIGLLVAVLALAPAISRAQAAGSAGAQARVDASLRAAATAGVPVALLERKVAEGKAKRVPMERIAAAVEARVAALVRARDALANARVKGATEGDLSVAADAVQAGVSDAAVVEVSRSAPADHRAVAIAVLTDLVALGHAERRAVGEVQSALRRGPEALANLRADASTQLQVGGVGAGVQVDGGAGVRLDLPGARAQ